MTVTLAGPSHTCPALSFISLSEPLPSHEKGALQLGARWYLCGLLSFVSTSYPEPAPAAQTVLPAFPSAPLHPRGAQPSASLDPLPGLWHPLVDNPPVPRDWPQNAPCLGEEQDSPGTGLDVP